jgi:2-polyprenyl-3-methyl-5-hydroxy-6-metoxy-1,4-benzoquinol methylase
MFRLRRLLDFGCGSGRLFPLYLENGIYETVGLDVSAKTLAMCRERYPSDSVRSVDGLSPADDSLSAFDLIVCNRVLQHIHRTRSNHF